MSSPDITISGLAELASELPNDCWHELRVRFRKRPDNTADVYISRNVHRLSDVYEADGVLWYRSSKDELQILD